MSVPIRWPKNLESYRTDTLERAEWQAAMCDKALRALDDGNIYLVRLLITEIKCASVCIQMNMVKAKIGRDAED